jgi:hypothetical protein
VKLSDVIQFDPKSYRFTINAGQEVNASDAYSQVDALLARLSRGAFEDNGDSMGDHRLLAAAMTAPIEQAIPYVSWTGGFFMDAVYGELEDNRLPTEDIVVMAWLTHGDGEVLFTRPGIGFVRPDFQDWDTGIELPWKTLAKAGWNVSERMMRRATEALARKIDTAAKAILDAACVGTTSHASTVAGGSMTKAAVDAVIKYQTSLGYPPTRVVLNSARAVDMSGWTGGVFSQKLPDARIEELMRTFFIGTYGGANWYTNPFIPQNYIYFAGPPENLGYHQIRGSVQSRSDVNIVKKFDLHTMQTAEHAWYIGNAYSLHRLEVTS